MMEPLLKPDIKIKDIASNSFKHFFYFLVWNVNDELLSSINVQRNV